MAAANRVNRQWRLKSRPTGLIKADNFELVSEPMSEPGEGQLLIRSVYLSLDPAMRGWLIDRPSYVPPVQIGEIMRGLAVGIVEKSNHPKFATGDRVQGMFGWQEYLLSSGEALTKLPETGLPFSAYLGLFGLAGLTAYAGLLEVGQPKSGETLLVSGAAGSVGSLVGQIGKVKGLRVVGIAGTDEKCKWLLEELAFDGAVNYKDADCRKQLKAACPKGVDIYFENVGGEILETALSLINTFGRMVICGLISQYNATAPVPGPSNFAAVISKRLKIQGFLAIDYSSKVKEMVSTFTQWHSSGQLKYRVDIVRGLESAPAAINKLFEGSNHGKLMVQLSDPPE
ncbi:MAG TPA: NADP-dependent oxidoreductase [Candidatus Deferrimicrobiaceae bacterium]|nr:NADP-dependent oxidoreductase [Candidatus Deferrimicrobiaceae bacterium]